MNIVKFNSIISVNMENVESITYMPVSEAQEKPLIILHLVSGAKCVLDDNERNRKVLANYVWDE